jgi:hypothetical protein
MMNSDDPQSAQFSGSFGDPGTSSVPGFMQPVATQYNKYTRQYQALLDRSAPHVAQRWLATAGLVAIFILRVVLSQGVSVMHLMF